MCAGIVRAGVSRTGHPQKHSVSTNKLCAGFGGSGPLGPYLEDRGVAGECGANKLLQAAATEDISRS